MTAFPTHAVARDDVELGLRLYERSGGLDVFDALLAAVAVNRGIDAVVSADRAFEQLAEVEGVDPADVTALDRLAG